MTPLGQNGAGAGHTMNAWGRLTTLFRQTFQQLGGEVVLNTTTEPDDTDFTTLLNDVA